MRIRNSYSHELAVEFEFEFRELVCEIGEFCLIMKRRSNFDRCSIGVGPPIHAALTKPFEVVTLGTLVAAEVTRLVDAEIRSGGLG